MKLRTALAASAAVLLLAGCGDDPEPVADDPAASEPTSDESTPPSDESSEDPSPSDDPDGTPTSSGDRTAAVYYVGDTGRAGPRLFREFRRGSGEPLEIAVSLLTEAPLDPDYRTVWQAGQLLGATEVRDVVEVEVDPSVRQRPSGMSKADARAAVEQVIYTVQAAVRRRAPVQFRTADNPIDQVFGVPTAEPLAQGSALEVLNHVSLTAPEQGATVSGDQLKVSGVANSFEANVLWEIRQGDQVVQHGFVTAEGWMGNQLFPFETTVDIADLDAGDYTLVVSTDDPSGGAEGIGAMVDDKDFTVE